MTFPRRRDADVSAETHGRADGQWRQVGIAGAKRHFGQGRIEIGPFGGTSKSARQHQAFLVTPGGQRLLLRRHDGPSMRDESLEALAGQEVVAEGLLRDDLFLANKVTPVRPQRLSPNGDIARMSPFADFMRSLAPTGLGRIIRQRRRELELDQASLAKRVGVSRQWIVEVERGKERAEVGLVLRTLAALGLDVTLSPRVARGRAPGKAPGVFLPGMVDLGAIIDRARGRK